MLTMRAREKGTSKERWMYDVRRRMTVEARLKKKRRRSRKQRHIEKKIYLVDGKVL